MIWNRKETVQYSYIGFQKEFLYGDYGTVFVQNIYGSEKTTVLYYSENKW